MARKKMEPVERILKMVNAILDDGTMSNTVRGVENQYADHTLFKLTSFNHMQHIYCQVMKKQDWLEHCYYVDLMGGSGCTNIKGTSLYALGSPILAAKNSNEADQLFEKIICVEPDENRANALFKRLCLVYPKDRVEVYNNRAEDVIPDILREISGRGRHSLTCIDYQNLQGPGFDDLNPVFSNYGDLMMTLMTQTLWRIYNLAKKDDFSQNKCKALINFFGEADDSWKTAESPDDLEQIYKSKIRNFDRRVECVKIQNEHCGFNFSTVFSSKHTRSGSPFLKGIAELNEFYSLKPDILKIVTNKFEKKGTMLDDFL